MACTPGERTLEREWVLHHQFFPPPHFLGFGEATDVPDTDHVIHGTESQGVELEEFYQQFSRR